MPKYSTYYTTTPSSTIKETNYILLNSDISVKNLSFPDKDKG